MNTLTNPGTVGSGTGHPDNNYFWNLPLADRQVWNIKGTFPSEVIVDAENGWCYDHYYSQTRRLNPTQGPNLYYWVAFGAGFLSTNDHRESSKGDWITDDFPYPVPYGTGIEPFMEIASHGIEIGERTGFPTGPRKLRVQCRGSGTAYYYIEDAYPTHISPMAYGKEEEVTTISGSGVWFDGEVELEDDEVFPCSRSSWVFTSTSAEGTTYSTGTLSPQFGIAGPSTLTITPIVDEPYGFGCDANDEYHLEMSIGQPLAGVCGFGVSSCGKPGTSTLESLSIDLVRQCVNDASIPDDEGLTYSVASWYGEDSKYNARLSKYNGGYNSESWLFVERKEDWPGNGASPRVAMFRHYGQYGVYYSPPECSPEEPRYTIDAGNARGGGCSNDFGGSPLGCYPLYPCDQNGFAFTYPTLTKTGSITPCPKAPRDNETICKLRYLVCWASDGSKAYVQELDEAVDSSSSVSGTSSGSGEEEEPYDPLNPGVSSQCPSGCDRSVIVTKVPCTCYSFGGSVVCERRYVHEQESTYDPETGITTTRGDYVNLQAWDNRFYPGARPPSWHLDINQECHPRSFYFDIDANPADADDAICPRLGDYTPANGGRQCTYGLETCNDCEDCTDAASSFLGYINMSESGAEEMREQYAMDHDGDYLEELPYSKGTFVQDGDNCRWTCTTTECTWYDGTHQLDYVLEVTDTDPSTGEDWADGKPHWLFSATLTGDGETEYQGHAPCTYQTKPERLDFETITNNLAGSDTYSVVGFTF